MFLLRGAEDSSGGGGGSPSLLLHRPRFHGGSFDARRLRGYSFLYFLVRHLPALLVEEELTNVDSRARRDDYGNLVPAESPISGMNPVKTAKRPVLPSPVTAEVPLLA